MYRRVLLAYDGTIENARALREGALLARALKAEVCLLCVVPKTAGVMMAEGAYCGVAAQQRTEYEELLHRLTTRLKGLGFAPKSYIVEGAPAAAIAATAKQVDADLVVVGHHNESFLSRWWSGSDQDYLSEHLECSLLVGRNPISDEDFEAELKRGQDAA